jgi:hypothetical protein
VHAIVDGGYHAWHCLIEPSKSISDIWVSRFGKRLESVRKPSSECIFGVMKKRFRCLKEEFHEEQMSKIGDVFRVCCALHNRLTRYHDLHTIGDKDSDWQKINTSLDDSRIQLDPSFHVPEPRVNHAAVGNETHTEREVEHDERMAICQAHFRVAYEKGEILWPKTALMARGHRRDERPLEGGRGCTRRRRRRTQATEEDDDDEGQGEDEEEEHFAPSDGEHSALDDYDSESSE